MPRGLKRRGGVAANNAGDRVSKRDKKLEADTDHADSFFAIDQRGEERELPRLRPRPVPKSEPETQSSKRRRKIDMRELAKKNSNPDGGSGELQTEEKKLKTLIIEGKEFSYDEAIQRFCKEGAHVVLIHQRSLDREAHNAEGGEQVVKSQKQMGGKAGENEPLEKKEEKEQSCKNFLEIAQEREGAPTPSMQLPKPRAKLTHSNRPIQRMGNSDAILESHSESANLHTKQRDQVTDLRNIVDGKEMMQIRAAGERMQEETEGKLENEKLTPVSDEEDVGIGFPVFYPQLIQKEDEINADGESERDGTSEGNECKRVATTEEEDDSDVEATSEEEDEFERDATTEEEDDDESDVEATSEEQEEFAREATSEDEMEEDQSDIEATNEEQEEFDSDATTEEDTDDDDDDPPQNKRSSSWNSAQTESNSGLAQTVPTANADTQATCSSLAEFASVNEERDMLNTEDVRKYFEKTTIAAPVAAPRAAPAPNKCHQLGSPNSNNAIPPLPNGWLFNGCDGIPASPQSSGAPTTATTIVTTTTTTAATTIITSTRTAASTNTNKSEVADSAANTKILWSLPSGWSAQNGSLFNDSMNMEITSGRTEAPNVAPVTSADVTLASANSASGSRVSGCSAPQAAQEHFEQSPGPSPSSKIAVGVKKNAEKGLKTSSAGPLRSSGHVSLLNNPLFKNAPLAYVHKIEVWAKHLDSVYPGGLISDVIIHLNKKWLTEFPAKPPRNVELFDGGILAMDKPEKPKSITWMGRSLRASRLQKKEYLLFPANWFNVHWFLIVVAHPGNLFKNNRRKKPKIVILDSKRNLGVPYDLFVETLKKNLASLYKPPGSTLENPTTPFKLYDDVKCEDQGNGYDCGIYVIHWIREFLKHSTTFGSLVDELDENPEGLTQLARCDAWGIRKDLYDKIFPHVGKDSLGNLIDEHMKDHIPVFPERVIVKDRHRKNHPSCAAS